MATVSQRGPHGPKRKRHRGERWHIAADWCEAFSPLIWQQQVEEMTADAHQAREAGGSIVWLVDSTSFGGRRRVGEGNGVPLCRIAALAKFGRATLTRQVNRPHCSA